MHTIDVFLLSYNNEKYLESACLSVLNQVGVTIHLTVIDDCSTDSSIEILNALKRKYDFQIIENKCNLGITKNVNIAVSLATSDYFSIHSSDDVSYLDRYYQEAELLERNEQCGFVCSSMTVGSDNVGTTCSKRTGYICLDLSDLLSGRYETTICSTFRTKALKDVRLYENYMSEDPQIYFLALLDGFSLAIRNFQECMFYRVSATNMTNTRMNDLLTENLQFLEDLSRDYSVDVSHNQKLIRGAMLSSLAQDSSIEGLKYLFRNLDLIIVKGFYRSLLKIILPQKAIYALKKN